MSQDKKAVILCFANQKGGVGKTSIVLNVGASLARRRKKVLLIDLDQQANLTTGLGKMPKDLNLTIADVMVNGAKVKLKDILIPINAKMDLAPANGLMSDKQEILSKRTAKATALYEAISAYIGNYDYILIDSPPSFDYITLNGMFAADYIYCVVMPEFYSLQGLNTMYGIIRNFNHEYKGKKQIDINGVIVNMYQQRRNLHKEMIETLKEKLPQGVLVEPFIKNAVAFAESPAYGENIFEYAPKSDAAKQISKLTTEIIDRSRE